MDRKRMGGKEWVKKDGRKGEGWEKGDQGVWKEGKGLEKED